MHNPLELIAESSVDSQNNPAFDGSLNVRKLKSLFDCSILKRSYVPNSRRVV